MAAQKVAKYRPITTAESRTRSTPVAFIPLPFSIMGRLHKCTHGFVRELAVRAATNRLAASQPEYLRLFGPQDEEKPDDEHRKAVHTVLRTLSTMIVDALVSNMFRDIDHALDDSARSVFVYNVNSVSQRANHGNVVRPAPAAQQPGSS